MRWCVSDIHGYYGLFCRLLDKIGFGEGDTLYVLGDFLDKGPEPIRLAKMLLSMPEVRCIKGNHEYDFAREYRFRMQNEGGRVEAIAKMRARFPDGEKLTEEIAEAIAALPLWLEESDFIGVHAGLPVRAGRVLPPEEAEPSFLVNDRNFKEPNVLPASDKCVIYGHTPVRYLTGRNEILFYPRPGIAHPREIGDCIKVHIDTGTYLGGVLGCICLDDCRTCYVRDPVG